jgi:hypothetical protein
LYHAKLPPTSPSGLVEEQYSDAAILAVVDDLRLDLIAEAADAATGFIVAARRQAIEGDVVKLGDCLSALWRAAQLMRKTYREIGGVA